MDRVAFQRNMHHLHEKVIIQFSPIRSGSTLVFNILREIFPNRSIIKRHQCGDKELTSPVVVTFRHPLDCIASSIQRYEARPTHEILLNQISEFNANGALDILKIKGKPNVLMLKYEEFVNDFEVIFKKLENFFKVKISADLRNMITERYNIESVEKRIESMSSFSEYDKTTHWHGKHISEYKGKTYYYRDFFKENQIQYLTKTFNKYLIEFGYI